MMNKLFTQFFHFVDFYFFKKQRGVKAPLREATPFNIQGKGRKAHPFPFLKLWPSSFFVKKEQVRFPTLVIDFFCGCLLSIIYYEMLISSFLDFVKYLFFSINLKHFMIFNLVTQTTDNKFYWSFVENLIHYFTSKVFWIFWENLF